MLKFLTVCLAACFVAMFVGGFRAGVEWQLGMLGRESVEPYGWACCFLASFAAIAFAIWLSIIYDSRLSDAMTWGQEIREQAMRRDLVDLRLGKWLIDEKTGSKQFVSRCWDCERRQKEGGV